MSIRLALILIFVVLNMLKTAFQDIQMSHLIFPKWGHQEIDLNQVIDIKIRYIWVDGAYGLITSCNFQSTRSFTLALICSQS